MSEFRHTDKWISVLCCMLALYISEEFALWRLFIGTGGLFRSHSFSSEENGTHHKRNFKKVFTDTDHTDRICSEQKGPRYVFRPISCSKQVGLTISWNPEGLKEKDTKQRDKFLIFLEINQYLENGSYKKLSPWSDSSVPVLLGIFIKMSKNKWKIHIICILKNTLE